jgi:hypothetical protein
MAASETTRPSHTLSMISSFVLNQQREQREDLRLKIANFISVPQLDSGQIQLETAEVVNHQCRLAHAGGISKISP